MRTLLRQAARLVGYSREKTQFNKYRDITPINPPRRGNALSKVGRLSLRGKVGNQAVKIYEAANPTHASFIEQVSGHPHLTGSFPEVYARHGAFVVADWVHPGPRRWLPGTRRQRAAWLEELVILQLRLHRLPLDALPHPGFDYWHDFIWPRFERAVGLLEATDVAQGVRERVGHAWAQKPQSLMHPDLTPANLIRSPGKGLTSVDNELLTIGGLALMDVCNTANALGNERGGTYIHMYFERATPRSEPHDLEVLRAAWMVRSVGSAFVAGQVPRAEAILHRYRAGERVLPLAFHDGRLPTAELS